MSTRLCAARIARARPPTLPLVPAVVVAPRHALGHHLEVDVLAAEPHRAEQPSVLVRLGVRDLHGLAADQRLEAGGRFAAKRLARLRSVDVEHPNLMAQALCVLHPDRVPVGLPRHDPGDLAGGGRERCAASAEEDVHLLADGRKTVDGEE